MFRKLFDSPAFYFSAAALLLVAAFLSQIRIGAPDRPKGSAEDLLTLSEQAPINVVFIVIDMLRADRLGAYGYERSTSPVFDELSSKGVRFAMVESQSSWTKASMASMWTGMYPQRTGVHRYPHALPDAAVLPAEIFKAAGYRTAGIWRNGWVANNFGFHQGFDLYVRPGPKTQPANVKRHNPSAHALQGTDLDATESAIEFLGGVADDPFFLYVHYMDVHQYLYADVSPDFGTSFSDIYDSSIYWTDQNVGYLMTALQEFGLLDDTLVVIAADHGEAFFEHGQEGHARSIYRETQEVPLLFVPPFQIPGGVVVEERVANVDIWPTILDLVGLDPLPGAEGISLVDKMVQAGRGAEVPVESETVRSVYSQLDLTWGQSFGEVGEDTNLHTAVVKGPYRLIYRERLPGYVELFDQREDPLERVNIARENPEMVKELVDELDEFKALENEVWNEVPEVELDEMRLHQLRALGYMIDPKEQRGMKPLGEVLEEQQGEREKGAVPKLNSRMPADPDPEE